MPKQRRCPPCRCPSTPRRRVPSGSDSGQTEEAEADGHGSHLARVGITRVKAMGVFQPDGPADFDIPASAR